ncbi:MAG: type II secretion system protein, partial [Spirochaetia bacterium]|nr:type II secretion system protein [Spirochaetia bacterium]
MFLLVLSVPPLTRQKAIGRTQTIRTPPILRGGKMKNNRKKKAFTLTELLVVVIVI